jgi:hypothetical protein
MVRVCDLVLEVLDARFINKTRNLELEHNINSMGKVLIFVINKIDLVDAEEKKKELKKLGLYPYVLVSCKKRIGGRELRERIKIEAKKYKTRRERIQVGVIGYPNTGKSSLINFLTGNNSAKTAQEAGFTRGIQKIKLTTGILLMDTPGVIPNYEYCDSGNEKIAKNAIVNARSLHNIKNPDFVIHQIIIDYPQVLEKYYGIDSKGDSEILIETLGRKKCFLKKGGLVDADRTSRYIIKEWQEGKIKA